MADADLPAVRTSQLGFRVGGAKILDGVELEVARAELLGVIGPNGAGKTTLFDLLSGLLRPTSGSIELFGRRLAGLGPAERARLGLGRTFQTSNLFGALSVRENARIAAQARLGGAGRFWRRPRPSDDAGARASEALDTVGLGAVADRPAGSLSHGDKRKLELAILLARGSEVLLLDEPMAGVNSEDVPGLVELIAALRASGRTVLMVEHHLAAVLGLADRVAVLHHGRLVATGAPAEVMADAVVQEAYVGEPL
jgi:branched-chain amino acid transport system ATP-binding protein